MAQDLFRVERGFADDNIEYLSGSGAPAGVSGDTLTAPVGSYYSDSVSGDTYKKTANVGAASDWERMLDQSDYNQLSTLVGGGVQAVQDELDAVEDAVGLNADGTYTAPAGSNYIGAATTIKNALVALDTQAKTTADGLAQEIIDRQAADAAEVTARNAAIAVETQNRIDAAAAAASAQATVDGAQNLLIAGKVNRSGDTMGGNLAFNGLYTVTGIVNPVNAGDAVNKAYLENLINGLTWLPPVTTVVDVNPAPGADGTRVLNTTDGKIYTVVAGAFNAGETVPSGCAVMSLDTSAGWTFNGTTWVQFTGAGQITAGVGLKKTGNVIDINLGAGIAQLPTDEVGIDVLSSGGLFLTTDGSTSSTDTDAQLAIKLDGTTLVVGANGLKVSDSYLNGVNAGLAQEILDRQAADTAEVAARNAAIAVETQNRVDADAAEVTARNAAIAVETQNRIDADNAISAILGDARTEVNSGETPIVAATAVDTVGVAVGAAKWLVRVTGTGADAGKFSAFEVLAMSDSNGTTVTMVDYTVYAKLKKGTIAGLVVSAVLNGSNIELRVASTNGVKVIAVREVVRAV